jgi:hypothetical protein
MYRQIAMHDYELAFNTGTQVAALIHLLADEDVIHVERQDLMDILHKYGRKPPKDKYCDMLLWRTRKVLKPHGIEILAVTSGQGRVLYMTDEMKKRVRVFVTRVCTQTWSKSDETHTVAA